MDNIFRWDQSYLEPVITIALVLFGLLAYWVSITSVKLKKLFVSRMGEKKAAVEWIMFWRYSGVFFYALLPSAVIFLVFDHSISFYGVSFINLGESLIWSAALGALVILMQSRSARQPENTKQYPQIKSDRWNTRLVVKNSLGWFIYLFAYEYMYRGILLFGLIDYFGTWPAIMVNTIVYSLAHIPKGNREAVAAIPFGILLCVLTLRTGTIWIAVMVHLALALSNDYFALAERKRQRL